MCNNIYSLNEHFLLNVEVMAFALVRWIDEDQVSVIPVGWVLQPATIDESDLPIKGVCYWKKRTSKHDTIILAVSGMRMHVYKIYNNCNIKLIILP